MNGVCYRPVNGIGNSWADRVRGVHHAADAPVTSVKSVPEVAESMTESAPSAVSVHNEQPHQQAVTAATDKHQVSVGSCDSVMSGFICLACIAADWLILLHACSLDLSSQRYYISLTAFFPGQPG